MLHCLVVNDSLRSQGVTAFQMTTLSVVAKGALSPGDMLTHIIYNVRTSAHSCNKHEFTHYFNMLFEMIYIWTFPQTMERKIQEITCIRMHFCLTF